MRNSGKSIAGTLLLIAAIIGLWWNQVQSQETGITVDAKTAESGTDEKVRPYCEGWKKPPLAFFITGRQHGYIEPCGCTGLANQKGGLARRQTLYRDLKSRGWPLVPIDVGNQVRRFGPQPAIKFQTTMSALRDMKYEAVGIGPDDLRLDIGELLSEVAAPNGTPLVSGNVSVYGEKASNGAKIVKVGAYTIGITSVIGKQEQKGIKGEEVAFTDPAIAVKSAYKKFEKAGCNLLVLLCYASSKETLAIATSSAEAKNFNVVITAGGADEPALEPERIKGTEQSYVIQTGKKGMYVGILGIYPGTKKPIRYERIPSDKRFKDSPEMLKSLASYQDQLKDIYMSDWTRLILKPVTHPSGRKFVGSEACGDCHDTAFGVWQKTPHHEATHSIAFPNERSSIKRNFDPECLSCHVTGWDPQGYYPYVSGYEQFDKSKHLHGNGCENCHGPGSAHVAAENGEGDLSDAQIEAIRESMVLPLDKAEAHCLKCHDQDNDPDFQEDGAFEKYWEQIKHYE